MDLHLGGGSLHSQTKTVKNNSAMYFQYRSLLICCCLIFYTSLNALAQDTDNFEVDNFFKLGISATYSPSSFSGWGKVENSHFASFRGQVWHTSFIYKNLHARLASELIVTQRFVYPVNGISGQSDSRTGFGIVPAHLLIPFTSTKIKPFTTFSVGMLFLNDKFPAPNGASLNYLLNAGLGIEFSVAEHLNLQTGYTIQHMSNGNTGNVNPGIDSHAFFISLHF